MAIRSHRWREEGVKKAIREAIEELSGHQSPTRRPRAWPRARRTPLALRPLRACPKLRQSSLRESTVERSAPPRLMGEAINAHQSQSAWKLACANSTSSSLGGRSCWYSPTPRDLGSTRTSSAMGSCECERRPSEVIRGHQKSSGVIRGHEIAHLQPASERSCADRGWVECRVCHLHAMREAISMQLWWQSACNHGGRSPLGRVSGLPPACIEGGNQHAMREAISMQ